MVQAEIKALSKDRDGDGIMSRDFSPESKTTWADRYIYSEEMYRRRLYELFAVSSLELAKLAYMCLQPSRDKARDSKPLRAFDDCGAS